MVTIAVLRHAPALTGGRLAGRGDVDADCGDAAAFRRMRQQVRQMLGADLRALSSPARRCVQTAGAMGFAPPPTDPGLWEQDYGAWEGLTYEQLPDLGPLPTHQLAAHRPSGGESFDDMAARVQPVLRSVAHDTLIFGHAGTARAALALVVGHRALSFAIAPLSLTVLRRSGMAGAETWAIEAVNLTALP
ncbi:alpha-ribazole phosphatase [Paracoccus alcaliphilus]|uniref:Alpha-ribazole phosphatase n=1 Tax=Paracoccus alcaliphilus TaxID=34002 RepID=A0A1H8G9G2_9RHOB|nr:histidine phosphatase family protein [Paracoccus alcaliphilus]SEN40623.1 alpha-ribazole phosphatase [Paracoccus alcaliphilus]